MNPEVLCIAKWKVHKPYEFVNKSSFAYIRTSGIIIGAMVVEGNAFGGLTLRSQVYQVNKFINEKIKKAIVDRGYKGQAKIGITKVVMPAPTMEESYCQKKQRGKRCRSSAGIEVPFTQLKHDHRMLRDYLKVTAGDQINTLLPAAAYNRMKWFRLKR